jgi:hypothetical protein
MSQPPDDRAGASPDEDAGEALPLIELETLLRQSPSWRKRGIQISLLLAALMVVLATYWGVNNAGAIEGAPVALQPTAPPPSVSILSNVNYGKLTINGQPQRGIPPLTIKERSQPPYLITLDAPPFQPLTCQFPPVKTIAPYVFHPCDAGGVLAVNQHEDTTLEMLFTLANLPQPQQQQINTLISDRLTSQQTIMAPAQSAIATGLNPNGTISTALASGPLFATAFLVPITRFIRRGVFCFSFTCVGSIGFSTTTHTGGQVWQVLTPIALRWRFTTASGQVVSDVTFSSAPVPLNLALAYTADGWQLGSVSASPSGLSEQLSQLVCATGTQMLEAQTNALSGGGWVVNVLHDQGTAGCELQITQQAVDQGHFVWRFGALLAGDAKAHNTLPALPVASPADLAAVGG